MKRKWKLSAALLSVGICTACLTFPAAALTEDASDNAYLCDEANALLDSQFDEMMQDIQETADYIGMNVAVYIGGEPLGYGESSTITFCDDHYDDMFGINTDGVFLYIDMSGESDLFDYLSTSGLGQFYYTNAEDENRVNDIITDAEDYLPRGAEDVPQAVNSFCFNLRYYYDKGIPENYYIYNSSTGEYAYYKDNQIHTVDDYDDLPSDYTASMSWGKIILIACFIGIIAFVISLISIKMSYRFKKAGSMRNYLERGGVCMTSHEDRFLRQYQTRTRISSSSSGGGGGGGGGHSHSSSSGGSHGGGGGHR